MTRSCCQFTLPLVLVICSHTGQTAHAYIYRYINYANTESELAFASDFAIPVALAELSDWLITDVYFVVRELRVNEWFCCC